MQCFLEYFFSQEVVLEKLVAFYCSVTFLHDNGKGGIRGCRISMTSWLTGVGGKQGAALAVDYLLDNWHILWEGCGHHTQAGHHGVQGGNSSHHTEAWVKIWKQERNLSKIMQLFLSGKEESTHTLTVKHRLWSSITPARTKSFKFHSTSCIYFLQDSSVNSGDTQAAYT